MRAAGRLRQHGIGDDREVGDAEQPVDAQRAEPVGEVGARDLDAQAPRFGPGADLGVAGDQRGDRVAARQQHVGALDDQRPVADHDAGEGAHAVLREDGAAGQAADCCGFAAARRQAPGAGLAGTEGMGDEVAQEVRRVAGRQALEDHPGAPDQAAGDERHRRGGGVGDPVVLDEVAQARVEPVGRRARPGLHAGADRADVGDLALAHVDGRPAGGAGRGGRGRSRRSRGRSPRRRGRSASSMVRRIITLAPASQSTGLRTSGIGSGDDVAREQPRDRADPRRAFELAPERREAEGGGVRLAVGAVDVAAGEADVGVALEVVHQPADRAGVREGVGVQDVDIVRAARRRSARRGCRRCCRRRSRRCGRRPPRGRVASQPAAATAALIGLERAVAASRCRRRRSRRRCPPSRAAPPRPPRGSSRACGSSG